MTTTTFDLEQSIMQNWGITDDLRTIVTGIHEHGIPIDQVAAMLTGLAELYELKFDRTYNEFSDLVSKGKL